MHWRRKWQRTPVILPGESQGQGSMVGCSLWGRTESDTTACLENPRDRGAWWAVVYGVAQNWTQLKRLSSSSSSIHISPPYWPSRSPHPHPCIHLGHTFEKFYICGVFFFPHFSVSVMPFLDKREGLKGTGAEVIDAQTRASHGHEKEGRPQKLLP